jgi:hypothetical protein
MGKNKYREAVDNSGLSSGSLEQISRDKNYISGRRGAGVFCDNMTEAVPMHYHADGERVTRHGNSWITLGRDRPASVSSGYGGAGHTQASSIDIVVGRGGPSPNSEVYVNPSFANDAARIYISQKTDIDDNFRLNGTSRSTAKSGIGIKADAIRIIGRNGIKLVTQGMRGAGVEFSGSPGSGIDVMAGNNADGLQPMIRGDNMMEAMAGLEANLDQLYSLVLNFLKSQASFNASISGHIHAGGVQVGPSGTGTCLTSTSLTLVPAGVQATLATAEAMMSNFKGRMNSNIIWHNTYLNSVSPKYICSRYNKVN